MSGLTKKTVVADRILSTMLGVKEGELVSYAQLSKGLHKYIKDNDLKNLTLQPTQPRSLAIPPPVEPLASQPIPPTPSAIVGMKRCRDCGAEISANAVFCDLCGVAQ